MKEKLTIFFIDMLLLLLASLISWVILNLFSFWSGPKFYNVYIVYIIYYIILLLLEKYVYSKPEIKKLEDENND